MYVPFQVAEIFDDIHVSFDFTNKLLTDVVNEHAPLKRVVDVITMPHLCTVSYAKL